MSTATLEHHRPAHAARREPPVRLGRAEPDACLAQHRAHPAEPRSAGRRDAAADHLPAAVPLRLRRRGRAAAGPGTTTCRSCCPACSCRRWSSRPLGTGVGAERRLRQGRLRPLPQSADRPGRTAGRCRPGRRGPVPLSIVILMVTGLRARLPVRQRCRQRAAGLPAGAGVRAVAVLDLGLARAEAEDRAGRAGRRLPGDVPADLRQQRVRPDRHAAGLPAVVG